MKLTPEIADYQHEIVGYNYHFIEIASTWLHRNVQIEMLIPNAPLSETTGLLLLNDGQDFEKLGIVSYLGEMHLEKKTVNPFAVVAIHAGERKSEYGVIGCPDYLSRGANASNYERFIVEELFQEIKKYTPHQFHPDYTFYAGCSLGGLSAFDISLKNQHLFGGSGIFSGSLWWRSKSYEAGYQQHDRIIFNKINFLEIKNNYKCWLMAGTDDERNDRNCNGIIDAVDDTLDLFDVLSSRLNTENLELTIAAGGKHDLNTWKEHFPKFLSFAFGNKNCKN